MGHSELSRVAARPTRQENRKVRLSFLCAQLEKILPIPLFLVVNCCKQRFGSRVKKTGRSA
jgi:hypothetical protein